MARKKIIAGNWKMNMTPSEAVALVNELRPLVANDDLARRTCIMRKKALTQARLPLTCSRMQA